MATLADRRLSLYQALQSIENWNIYQYLIEAPQMPALMVGGPPEGDLDETFEGEGHFVFELYAICKGDQNWALAQQLIDPLLAPNGNGSLAAALDAQINVGGQIGQVSFSDYGPGANWAGAKVYMVKIRVEVMS